MVRPIYDGGRHVQIISMLLRKQVFFSLTVPPVSGIQLFYAGRIQGAPLQVITGTQIHLSIN